MPTVEPSIGIFNSRFIDVINQEQDNNFVKSLAAVRPSQGVCVCVCVKPISLIAASVCVLTVTEAPCVHSLDPSDCSEGPLPSGVRLIAHQCAGYADHYGV